MRVAYTVIVTLLFVEGQIIEIHKILVEMLALDIFQRLWYQDSLNFV